MLALFGRTGKLVAAKGKKTLAFDLAAADLDREALLASVIGPSGNLRAPTLRIGKDWLVGFSEELYAARFAG